MQMNRANMLGQEINYLQPTLVFDVLFVYFNSLNILDDNPYILTSQPVHCQFLGYYIPSLQFFVRVSFGIDIQVCF